MSWRFYLGGVVFFTVVFSVFYAIAWSVLLQVRENYLRYFQKSELQWTGGQSRFPQWRIRLRLVLPAALASAWLVVELIRRKVG